MKRRIFLLGTLAAGSLASCAPTPHANPLGREARAALRLGRIEVRTEGAAFESARARSQASQLGPDLEAELRRTFSDRLDPSGATLVVEIQQVNLAGGTRTAFGSDQSRMTGAVRLLGEDGRLRASYPVTVIAGEARETTLGALAAATVGSADRFYRTLLVDFARTTRSQMLGPDLPGARLMRQIGAG